MQLRRSDVCATCGAPLREGATAWWDARSRRVTCVVCHARVAAPDPIDRGVAGASARREGQRRSAKREEQIRARHPRLGGLVLALSDDPSSTKVWSQGAVGEEKVGAVLDAAQSRGIEVLHDRRLPRSRANVDHLVVAPSGIWVVDAKRYVGRLERRDVGGWRRSDVRLFVKGRDKTALVDGVAGQVGAVRAALAGTPWSQTPVHGCLCFVDTEVGVFAKPFRVRSILVTWRKRLVGAMLTDAVLDAGQRRSLVTELAARFPAA